MLRTAVHLASSALCPTALWFAAFIPAAATFALRRLRRKHRSGRSKRKLP